MRNHADSTLAAEFRNIYTVLDQIKKTRPVVVVGANQPTSPVENTIWVNGTAHTVKLWDGSVWITLS